MASHSYPAARRQELTEDVLGYQVSDPYRWLEDPGAEHDEWLAAQADLFAAERATWPHREEFAGQVRELLETGFAGVPAWRGNRSFYLRRDPGQEHGILYTTLAGGQPSVLVDPVALDPSGLTTLDAWQPDKEGRLLAYQTSSGGDEESVLQVIDVQTGALVDGPIDRCRYSGVAWLPGGKAFYYSRRLPPEQVPADEVQYHRRVYLHQVGTPAAEDVLIFGEGRDKTDYYGVSVSMDGRWLVISASPGTAPRNDLWLADLHTSSPEFPGLRTVIKDEDAQTSLHVGRDGRLYVFTDLGAPRGRLAVADPAEPEPSQWRDLISEDPVAVLRGYALLDDVLLAAWTRHAVGELTAHDLVSGGRTAAVTLPGLGSVSSLSERPEGGHEAWFGYTDYITPQVVLHYDARSGAVSTWARPAGSPPAGAPVTTRQVAYQSKDGTTVRMLVISPSDPGQPRPTILYGYGGFDISLTPAYAANILTWVRAGGVYAVAGLRGGSEEGEAWHRDGMRDKKQNVFDDFHAAGEALVAGGWTTHAQLAISGGSNGGLLVGAALTQQPSRYAAVICSAALLDMVRYERFGLGQLWHTEFGTAADPVQLGWLLGYSPYHHVVSGTGYPAVLFTVFTNDSRVDPLHAYKMCAALQHATAAADRPVLLRAEAQVGHGARAISRTVDLSADTLAFAARYTGLE